ncbi:MAG: MFS transporter [Paracoccaceae bacterium]
MAAAVLASAMGFIDSSVTAVAVPVIRVSLEASLAEAQWFSGAYLLTLSALVLIGGAMADRFGIARVFAGGILGFVLASLLCAAATTPGQLIAARALQGLAAGVMVPGSMVLVSRAYPKAERGRALGLWAAATTATTALGPVLGGALLSLGGVDIWRLIFAINLPLGVAALTLLQRYTLSDRGKPGTPIDLIGAGLATLGLGMVAWGLTSPGTWSLPATGLGLLVFAAFLAWERVCRHPMIRLGMFANRAFAAANLATFLLYVAITGIGFYMPMTAMSGWGLSPFEVSLAFLPTSVQIALLSPMVGRWADRIGPFIPMTLGAFLVTLAQAGMIFLAPNATFWWDIFPLLVLSGFGIALVLAPLTVAVMAEASDDEQGAASGINNVMARAATLVAVALMGRIASEVYGDTGPGMPGFGLTATTPEHVAATGVAFAWLAGVATVCSLASAIVSALQIKRLR